MNMNNMYLSFLTLKDKNFILSLILRTAKEGNSLPTSVFPNAFRPNQVRVNRLQGKLTPSSTLTMSPLT